MLSDGSSLPQKNQPTKLKSLCLATFMALPPQNQIFSYLKILCKGLKIGYYRYTRSLLYTFKEFDQKHVSVNQI